MAAQPLSNHVVWRHQPMKCDASSVYDVIMWLWWRYIVALLWSCVSSNNDDDDGDDGEVNDVILTIQSASSNEGALFCWHCG